MVEIPPDDDDLDANNGRRARPRSLDPIELGFVPQPPVAWLERRPLAELQSRLAPSTLSVTDTREMQAALPSQVYDMGRSSAVEPSEYWLDYVAGTGDGFNATYTVAYLLAQPALEASDHVLPGWPATSHGR